MTEKRVVIVGAGIAGLTAALRLALHGMTVTVVEKAGGPGGKMREVEVGGARMDAGPTVFTLPYIFEEIFAEAGDHACRPRHPAPGPTFWRGMPGPSCSRLDLFADIDRSADAIGRIGRERWKRKASGVSPRGGAADLEHAGGAPMSAVRSRASRDWSRERACAGLRYQMADQAVRHALGRPWRLLPGPAPAPAFRALRHILRLLAVPGSRHADAGGACRAGRSLAGRGRHGAAGGSTGGAGARLGRCDPATASPCSRSPRAPAGSMASNWRMASGSRRMPWWSMPIPPPWRRDCSGHE